MSPQQELARRLSQLPLLRQILAKVSKKLSPIPPQYRNAYHRAIRNERLVQGELHTIQNTQLRAIVHHAYQHVPYYHRLFKHHNLQPEQVKTVKDLAKIPTVSKDIIQSKPNHFLADNIESYGATPNRTSGSTGMPLTISLSRDTRHLVGALNWVCWRGWMGFRWGERIVYFRPAYPVMKGQWHTKPPSQYYHPSKPILYLSPYELSETILRQHATALKKFKPKLICGTPSAIYLMAQFLVEHNIDVSQPCGISTSSEMLFSFQRDVIEQAFQTQVYDRYGSGEYVAEADQCGKGSYHIRPELGLIEIVKDGELVGLGETGEMVVTTLVNKAMPLIRYRIGDVAALSEVYCDCGRTLPLLEYLEGKIRDLIVSPDGIYISGEFFTWLIEQTWVQQGQLVQTKPDELHVKIVPKRKPTSEEKQFIVDAIRNLMGDVTVEIELVEEIEATKAGKRHFVISQVSQRHFHD